ncbi:hypothetical protein HMPREF6745_0527 [Prevotella sp. oral taxon 472 str. F0295]|nr:hypothetical protein [Prevotella sp. oral taxon 472]EEX53989.1 hypothetical protein HMPREF6745_0527 [Prevotella sp. oral taxon 472 str. F0295]
MIDQLEKTDNPQQPMYAQTALCQLPRIGWHDWMLAWSKTMVALHQPPRNGWRD